MMVASKGAAGVTGAGLATLAGGLQAHRPDLVDGVGVIVGIDRFMSEARALTNFTGNAVATLLVGTWTKQLDREQLRGVLAGEQPFDEATMSVDDHLSADEQAEVAREERPSTATIAAIVGELDDEKAVQEPMAADHADLDVGVEPGGCRIRGARRARPGMPRAPTPARAPTAPVVPVCDALLERRGRMPRGSRCRLCATASCATIEWRPKGTSPIRMHLRVREQHRRKP